MSAIDLTTPALVKEWMPAPAGTPTPAVLAQQNSVLQSAITSASLDFLRRTGRGPQNFSVPEHSPFCEAVEYSEVYNGSGTDMQFLRNWPILSVSSLVVNGVAMLPSPGFPQPGYTIGGSGKFLTLSGGAQGWPYARGGNGWKFPNGTQNVAVTYIAGFPAQTITNELQTISASPGPYIVTPALPWLSDGGVAYFSNGNPLTPVQIAPAAGQYYVNGGIYLFNAPDTGKQILLIYSATGTPPDIELAARKMVYLVYLRRSWEGLRSLAKPESGTTSYSSWEIDPSVAQVIDNYARKAIV